MFHYVWLFPFDVHVPVFIKQLEQRLRDNYTSSWSVQLKDSNSLYLYKEYKVKFELERYFTEIANVNHRTALSKLRLSSHCLCIETGRHGSARLPRDERYCLFCNLLEVEDEYHFILICPFYSSLRLKYISKYYYQHPSVYKFISLMSTRKLKCIKQLARYIYEGFQLRNM